MPAAACVETKQAQPPAKWLSEGASASAKSRLSAGPSPRLPQPRPGPWAALAGHIGLGLDMARRRQRVQCRRRQHRFAGAYVGKSGRIGGFGGGWLEHLRQWLCAQWPDLSPWVSQAARSHQARPEEAQELNSSLPRRHFDRAALPLPRSKKMPHPHAPPSRRPSSGQCLVHFRRPATPRTQRRRQKRLVRVRVRVRVRVGVGVRLRVGVRQR